MILSFTIVFVLYYYTGEYVSGGRIEYQRFRVKPQDVRVKEGDDVILSCEIDHLAGLVQWTKDGMALGYDADIQGYPRYHYVGDFSKGIYNLQIKNVSLDDDAEFQCQVGQKRTAGGEVIPFIREAANLTVIVPPSSIEIINYANNSKVDVLENQKLKLQCLVRSSRPSAKVMWYRGRNRYNEFEVENEEKNCKPLNKIKVVTMCDILSTVYVKPTLDDQAMNYSCVALHDALLNNLSLFSNVQLNILYPPGTPHITGYSEDDPAYMLSEGQKLELTCHSSGGNPLAQLRWFKNDVQLSKEIFYRINGKVAESRLEIVLKADDNDARYTCESSNPGTVVPLRATVKLSVAFGPMKINVTGSNDTKAGEVVTLTCTTSSSYPPAEVQWIVDGQTAQNKSVMYSSAEDGGSFTFSTLDLLIPPNIKEIVVHCYASNPRSSKNVNANHTIHVHYPPGPPVISGYVKGSHVYEGTKHQLTCTSSGGNPLADLTWHRNDEQISVATKKRDRTSSFAEIIILASRMDNGAIYRCEASNPTISEPLVKSIKLNVFFAPENATITKDFDELHVGNTAKLICNSSSSYPKAVITWWRNNANQITDGISVFEEPGPYGGTVSSSHLVFNVTSDMHKNVIMCRATNAIVKKSVNIAIQLDVRYKPVFVNSNHNSKVSVREGEQFSISCVAHANPPSITYHWMKDRKLLGNFVNNASLTLPKVNRHDAGKYTCEAENAEGVDRLLVELLVFYEADIVDITKVITVSSGSNAAMACTVIGNPLDQDTVWWINPNIPDLVKRSNVTFDNNTLTMELRNVTIRDMGLFYCIVNNGIGAEKNATTFLIVEHAPIAEKLSSEVIKMVSNISSPAKFICKGSGAPKIEFRWFKGETPLNKTVNYAIDNIQIDELHYESSLKIKQVTSADHGKYFCVMKNKLGSSSVAFELLGSSSPDSPSDLHITNITHNSILLSWSSNFDGGLPTKFRIRYFPVNKPEEKQYKDVDFSTQDKVVGLMSGTLYIFDVMAFNEMGRSDYSSMKVNATTDTVTPESPRIVDLPVEGEGLLLLIVAGIGVLLLLLNVLMILLCAWKRSKNNKKGLSDSRNKSVEMYATASKNSNDISSATFSSLQSDKLNDEENDVSSAYIVEDINYPFFEKNEPKDYYEHQLNGYSTVGHIHHVPPPIPPLNYYLSSNFSHTTTLPGRRRTSQIPDLRNGSPTPSIPPPMTAISTNTYRSLQCSNYLHL